MEVIEAVSSSDVSIGAEGVVRAAGAAVVVEAIGGDDIDGACDAREARGARGGVGTSSTCRGRDLTIVDSFIVPRLCL